MKKYMLIGFVWCGFANVILAQGLGFPSVLHDFGEIKEEGGSVEHTFWLINQSEESVQITNVEASCGCTTPGWTMESILPGNSGMVKALYDPFNRPGKFEKTLKVSYLVGNDGSSTEVLTIEGMVKPKPKSVEDDLPTLIGDLRLKFKSLNMGKITNNEKVVREFDVYNAGDSSIIWFSRKADLPSHILVEYAPDTLMAREFGIIRVVYDPIKKNDLGFVTDQIRLLTNDVESEVKDLNVIATITEFFPPMTEKELAKAPHLVFNEVTHDFGQVSKGDIVATTFSLTNTGKKDLIIRNIKSNCGCTVAELEVKTIKAGQTIPMEVSFNTSGRTGRQYKTVTVFSNDPSASTQMLTIKAEIKD